MKKNPIIQVLWEYTGTEESFRAFLESLVRGYVTVSYSDAKTEGGFVAPVEKEA